MKIDIRKSIKSNFVNNNKTEIQEAILASMTSRDEITLPGLGVFFELLWETSNEETKELIISNISKGL